MLLTTLLHGMGKELALTLTRQWRRPGKRTQLGMTLVPQPWPASCLRWPSFSGVSVAASSSVLMAVLSLKPGQGCSLCYYLQLLAAERQVHLCCGKASVLRSFLALFFLLW